MVGLEEDHTTDAAVGEAGQELADLVVEDVIDRPQRGCARGNQGHHSRKHDTFNHFIIICIRGSITR